MNKRISALIYTYLICKEYGYDDDDLEDIIKMQDPNICSSITDLYIQVIKLLSEGKSYEEIYDFVDNYKNEKTENLSEEDKAYIKTKVKKDLDIRKKNIEKGED